MKESDIDRITGDRQSEPIRSGSLQRRYFYLDAGEPLTSMSVGEHSLALGCLSGAVQVRELIGGKLQSVAHLHSPVLKLSAYSSAFLGGTEQGLVFRV